MRVMNLDQGSDDWLLWRQGGLGATTAPILLGLCPDSWEQSQHRLWQELTGRREKQPTNIAMQWGKDMEPLCRQMYESKTGIAMPPACVVHDRHEWARASLDGLNLKHRLLLELKVTNKDVHALALDGAICDHYHAQIQWQLFVTGYSEAHYFTHNNKSFHGEDQWAGPLTVERDNALILNLFHTAQAFWQCVQEDKPPSTSGFFGWFRGGRQRKWRRVAEAGTERECSRLLGAYADASGENHCEKYVGPCETDPNRKVRV